MRLRALNAFVQDCTQQKAFLQENFNTGTLRRWHPAGKPGGAPPSRIGVPRPQHGQTIKKVRLTFSMSTVFHGNAVVTIELELGYKAVLAETSAISPLTMSQ